MSSAGITGGVGGTGSMGAFSSQSSRSSWIRFLQSGATRLVGRGLDIVYPPRCPICRSETGDAAASENGSEPLTALGRATWAASVCWACAKELSADVRRCLRCGAAHGGGDDCRLCQRRRCGWRRVVVLSAYGGGLREAVLRAKRPAGEGVAAALATLLVSKHRETLDAGRADLVVPVPMHWLRRSVRGTSAADELAQRIGVLLKLPWCRALSRQRATRMQNELPIEERPRNVHAAFRARRRLDGATILLVDDVFTTGATLSACCQTLLAAGAAAVDVAVVARADGGAHADA